MTEQDVAQLLHHCKEARGSRNRMGRILTIGHSNHPLEKFVALLRGAGVTAVADVRSQPVSRFAPQFNKERLKPALAEAGIAYVFLGRELGGRPKDPALMRAGKPDYAAMAKTAEFAAGLERIEAGAGDHAIALMCAERDPVACHRFRLVARALAARGAALAHILPDGAIETQDETERRTQTAQPGSADLFG
jgi:uncharacterized protein (DUF488 family)